MHLQFVNDVVSGNMDKYHFKQWLLFNRERASINCICFSGNDLWKTLPIQPDDEDYLASVAPLVLKKYNSFFGEKTVSHFSFLSQGTLQDNECLLQQYEQLLNIDL
jgi:hypothetical protein